MFNKKDIVYLTDPEVINYQIYDATLTLFKQSRFGPESMGDNYLPFITEDSDVDRELYRIASFYSVAIGQGNYYHTGIFGPLPVLGSNYRCMVFGAMVEDSDTFDERMKGWNYILACFFFHESLIPVIFEKKGQLEAAFQKFFHRNKILELVTDTRIQVLKLNIIDIIQDC